MALPESLLAVELLHSVCRWSAFPFGSGCSSLGRLRAGIDRSLSVMDFSDLPHTSALFNSDHPDGCPVSLLSCRMGSTWNDIQWFFLEASGSSILNISQVIGTARKES